MSDDNWGAAEPIRQSIHDLVSKFTGIFGKANPSEPTPETQHADPGMVNEANESFRKAAEKMKGQSNSYDSTKKQPLKSYSK